MKNNNYKNRNKFQLWNFNNKIKTKIFLNQLLIK